jgi:uncharacterized membrane protein YfcA
MITFPELPGVDINILLLIFIGFGAGILSGFAGVGGAFIVTPALIILGFPANLAVGSGLAWVMGSSIVGAFRHRKLGNVDVKLGMVILVGAMGGTEVGVRILNWTKEAGLADETVLSISICVLLIVGSYTVWESIRRKIQLDGILEKGQELPPAMRASALSQKLQRIGMPPTVHFATSDTNISLWIVLAIGFFIGTLAGIMGVGGGIIMVPSLVYIVGLPSFMAVGTSLFQTIFSAAYGCIRHTMSGNVIIFAAFIMVIASSIGVQFGALVTRYVRGVSVRIILGTSILLFAVGTILKLLGVLLDEASTLFEVASMAVTFSGLGLTLLMILGLFIASLRYNRGRQIPAWVKSLVSKTT